MSADVRALITDKSLSKVGGLLHSLVPRAKVFCFYTRHKECIWSSDGGEDFEVDNFVTDLPREAIESVADENDCVRRTLSSGRTVLALPVLDDVGKHIGLLTALFSKNDGKSSSFNPKLLKKILAPAIDLIADSVGSSRELRKLSQDSKAIRQELEFVYELDEKIYGASGRHSSLAQLVGRSGRFLGINYTVLLIPSKRIRISATHSSWKAVNRKVLDRYLIDQLMPKLEGERKPVVFEVASLDDDNCSVDTGYQALLCPLLDRQGNVEGVLAQLGRVDQSKFSVGDRRFMSHIGRKVEYVIEQSFDTMTGLMNRAGLEAQLSESFADLQSDSDTHQIIYFDLDNLQLVNDTFGRSAGDDVIRRFARLLEEDLPKSAVLSRLTGDDFCMLLTHADSDAALDYANKVRDKTAALRYLEGDKSLQVTISVGIAEFDRHIGDESNVLTTARMACEAAKEHGRDRVEIYDQSNRSVIRRYDDMQLVTNIQQALDGDKFELLAQPITGLSGNSPQLRYEVLLRMQDGEGGHIETKALFSAAERYRMMPQIDRWVVSKTIDCAHAAARYRWMILARG